MERIKHFFKTFYEEVFSLNMEDFRNIGVDFPINKILFCVMLGICLGMIVSAYHKRYMYITVKQLMRHEARSEQTAKTLAELGLSKSFAVRRAIASGGQLSRIVGRVGEQLHTYEEYLENEKQIKAEKKEQRRAFFKKNTSNSQEQISSTQSILKEAVDLDTAKFYIREEMQDRASRIFSGAGVCWWRTALACVLVVFAFLFLMICMPSLLTLINGWLG